MVGLRMGVNTQHVCACVCVHSVNHCSSVTPRPKIRQALFTSLLLDEYETSFFFTVLNIITRTNPCCILPPVNMPRSVKETYHQACVRAYQTVYLLKAVHVTCVFTCVAPGMCVWTVGEG